MSVGREGAEISSAIVTGFKMVDMTGQSKSFPMLAAVITIVEMH